VESLKIDIDSTLCRLEGIPSGQKRMSSPFKEHSPVKSEMDLKSLETVKRLRSKGVSELQLLLDLVERQEAWPLHSEAERLKQKMQSGQPAEVIEQLEARLEMAKSAGTKAEKRKSVAPSPCNFTH